MFTEDDGGLDLSSLQYEPLAERPSKVKLDDLGRVAQPNPRTDDWLDHLPKILAGRELRRLRDAILSAVGERPAGPCRDGGARREDGLFSLPD